MSKILSVLSGIAVIVLLVVLGGTLIGLADSRAQIDAGTRASVGTAFTYQGHLTEGQSPADGRYDFTFALYDDPDEGSPVGPTLSEVVTVTNSLFSVELDFGSVFDGTALWLEIGVRPEGDTDPHTPLLPRQRLTAAPFATFANSAASAPWTGLTGVPAGFADDIDDDTLYQAGEGLDLVDTTFAITLTYQLPQECEPDQFIRWTGTGWACTEAGTGITGWSLSGNSGTTPGADFLGTTDDAALQLHVNGNRALRLEPDGTSPNIVGGYGGNDVGPGTSGATIGGGGRDLAINAVSADFGTVGGGAGNTATAYGATVGGGEANSAGDSYAAIGGGYYNAVSATFGTIAGGGPTDSGNPTTTNNRVYDEYGAIGGGGGNSAGFEDSSMTSQRYATVAGGETNAASNSYATVGGGTGNGASGYASTVGGGAGNSASNNYATVGGGTNNSAGNNYAAVGGGDSNNVTGLYGTIPGGRQNAVGGTFGFAAGMQAHAEHNGTFVWSSSPGVFASTGPGQFLIDASGGVGIGTDSPVQMLTVQGSAEMLSSDAVSVSVVYSHSRTLDAPNALYAAGDLLYVTSYSTNTLSIWNVSNPEKVEPVGYTTSNLLRPTDIFVSGQRAYVTSESNNRLVAFDLSNPSAPDSLGSTGEGLANPIALYVAGKYAYVVSDGPGTMDGLAIFDVSDPTHMRLRDDTNVGMVAPTDVFVAGSRAYVTSMGNNSLVIYDVSDPRPGQIQALGSVTGPMYAPRAVFVSGPYAYVVSDSDDLVIFDISNPDSIVTAGSTSTNLSNPLDVFITGDLAYVASSGNDRLAIFDISDPANIADLGFAETGDKPVSLFVAGKQIYVANETGNSVSLYEATHLQAPTLQTGSLQTGNLDVIDNATVSNDLAVHGGLQVGASGARIGGALSVTGPDDSYILGALSVGGAGALISDTVYLTRTQWMTAPTHALDVIGEGRFRVNDYTNLVLRSANAGSDEDAYVDFIRSDQTTVLTPSARIEFDAADPLTHTTGIRFYTQGRDDTEMLSRLEITSRGDVRPGADGVYLLGIPGRRWHTVYSVNGIQTGSDGRYKENVSALPYGLDEVKALHPVMFTWIEHPDDGPYYGLIAQEVRQVLPDIVRGDEGEDGMLGMNYSELVPVLVKAVQEQQAEIESQAEQIAGLETRLDALEKAQPTRTDQPGALNLLATFGIGGLMLGAVWVAGTRRRGGQS